MPADVKMTATEWNTATEFLETADEGSWVEHNNRTITVENMCGGRYLLFDENWEVRGLVDEEWKALHFLNTGKVL